MAVGVLGQRRLDLAADVGRARAARVEDAARTAGRSGSGGSPPTTIRSRARFSRGSGIGIADSSAVGVRVDRLGVELLGGRELHDLAEVHDRDAVGDVAHDRRGRGRRRGSVRPKLVLEVVEQVDDLRLDRDVERRDRLVEHDQLRLQRQRAGDPDALALAAGELVREAVDVLGAQADDARAARGALPCRSRRPTARAAAAASPTICPTRLRGFSDANGSWKTICISRRSGRSRSRRSPCVMSVPRKRIVPSVGLEQPQHRARQRRLAAARLADEAERLALAQRERHVVDRVHVRRPSGRPARPA